MTTSQLPPTYLTCYLPDISMLRQRTPAHSKSCLLEGRCDRKGPSQIQYSPVSATVSPPHSRHFSFKDMISLYIPGWLGTGYRDLTCLSPTEISLPLPPSAGTGGSVPPHPANFQFCKQTVTGPGTQGLQLEDSTGQDLFVFWFPLQCMLCGVQPG